MMNMLCSKNFGKVCNLLKMEYDNPNKIIKTYK